MCFLCLWNSRADEQYYSVANPPTFNSRKNNVKHTSLVDAYHIYLPALPIKLGIFKTLSKPWKKEEFTHINQKFSYKSEATLKQKIFVGPVARRFLKDYMFKEKLIQK